MDDLSGDDRLRLASNILDSTEMKQDICLQCPGITYRDIDRTMKAVLAEKKPKRDPEEDLYPEKYGKTSKEVFRPGIGKIEYRQMTREEVAELMRKSEEPIVVPEMGERREYRTYTREEVAALIACEYHPDNFRYLKKKTK